MDVVFRLVRCRVADGMPLLVQECICHRPQNGAPTCHSHPVSRKLPFSPESRPQNGSPPCQCHSVSMALSESGNLRGTLDCRVETQGTEPQDGELFGEEEVSDAFEEGGGDHLMMAFLCRWRKGFPRPEHLLQHENRCPWTKPAEGILKALCMDNLVFAFSAHTVLTLIKNSDE